MPESQEQSSSSDKNGVSLHFSARQFAVLRVTGIAVGAFVLALFLVITIHTYLYPYSTDTQVSSADDQNSFTQTNEAMTPSMLAQMQQSYEAEFAESDIAPPAITPDLLRELQSEYEVELAEASRTAPEMNRDMLNQLNQELANGEQEEFSVATSTESFTTTTLDTDSLDEQVQ